MFFVAAFLFAVWHEKRKTSTVQKWYDGTLANNGIVLMGDKNHSLSVDMNVRLASSDNANSTMIPRLIISYRDSKGLEDYWTYEKFNFSNICTAYVNVFNRNLTFVYNLYETPGTPQVILLIKLR